MCPSPIYRCHVVLDDEPRSKACFRKLKPRYVAIPRSELLQINLDLTAMTGTMLAVSSKVEELRPAIARLPDFPMEAVDDLRDAAMGLDYTHAEVMSRAHPSDDLEDLYREATQTRDRFLHDQANLAKNGVVDQNLTEGFSGLTGYKSVVNDIRTCIAGYRAIGSRADAKSCVTPEDIDRAEAVIHRMERLLGDRILGSNTAVEWVDLRTRAFSLAWNYYDQARRAVMFLRWTVGDVDSIAPSLYKGRIKRRRASTKPESAQPEAAKPESTKAPAPQPVIGPNGPFVPTNADPVVSAPARLPGMPGGNPFIQ